MTLGIKSLTIKKLYQAAREVFYAKKNTQVNTLTIWQGRNKIVNHFGFELQEAYSYDFVKSLKVSTNEDLWTNIGQIVNLSSSKVIQEVT